jgi:DNA-binding transcriptional ArsR family regulator
VRQAAPLPSSETAAIVAAGSPRRREILRLIWREELAAGQIHAAMPDVTFGAVSLQLGHLAAAGLVDIRADGRHRRYQARREAFGSVGDMLERMWDDALWRLKVAAELEQSRRGPLPRRPSRKAKPGAAR